MRSPKSAPSNSNTPFLTVRGFVSRSGLSEKAVRELVRQNSIPFIMCGNRAMIDAEGAILAIRQMAAKEAGRIA